MPKIRQYPEITSPAPTDAFIIDRAGEGTFYIEAQNFTAPPGTLVITQSNGSTVVPSTVAMNFTGGAVVTASGTTANVQIPTQNPGTITSVNVSGGTTGLTASGGPITSSGTITLGGILNVANGGTGTTAPALTAGSNITLTGSWPNYTIAATGITGGTVTSVNVQGGTTGLSFTGGPITSSGTITAAGILSVANGGTGTSTPGLIAGTNVSITGSWPNQTITASGGGGGGLAVGSSVITGGTSGYILYNAAGVLGNLATTGTGNVVRASSPALSSPNLGTPSAATLTNATGLPLTTGTTGILPVAKGGTGTATPALVAGSNVTITGTWPNQTIAASGGSSSLTVGSTAITGGTTGRVLYDNGGTLGEYTTIPVANGGTGTATPSLVAGSNVTITGSWPNQTIAASGGGGGSISVLNQGTAISTSLATLNFVGGGVSAAAVSTPPTVRGYNSVSVSAASINVPFPTGTVAGDLVYIAAEGGYALSSGPSGWTLVASSGTGTPLANSAAAWVFSKVVASGDVATGYATISTGGSYSMSGVSIGFVGAPTQRAVTAINNLGTMVSDATPQVGDIGVFMGLGRGNTVTACSTGTLQQSTSGGDGQAVIYTNTVSTSGVQSATFTWSGGGGLNVSIYMAGISSTSAVNVTVPGYVATPTQGSPQVRGYSAVTGSTASFNVPFPTGTVAGDFAILCGAGGYGPSAPPSGWTSLNGASASGIQGSTFSKTLTSGDLATGYVTVTFNNAYNGICQMVTFKGGAVVRNTQGNADGGTTLTSSSAVQVNDLGVHFATVRTGSIISVTPGNIRQSAAISDVSAAVYTAAASTAGAQSVVYNLTGDYYICSVFVDNVAGAYTVTGETTTIASGAPLVAAQEGYRYYDKANSYAPYIYDNGGWQQVGPLPSIPALANVPVASTFTYTLGSPTSKTSLANVGVLFDSGTFGSGDNITGYGVSVPGSTPYTFTLGMSSPLIQQANMIAGMFLTDGTKVVTIGNAAQSTGGVKIDYWANNTTYNGQPFWQTGQMYPFFRVTNNGTNLTYSYSLNGYSWLAFYQESISAYLGAITAVGFCINNTNTSGVAPPSGTHGQATIFYWAQS